METLEIKEAVTKLLEDNKISFKYKFIPFSQSRNKHQKLKSLNYLVTVLKDNKEALTIDYSMGQAYCPAYKMSMKDKYAKQMIINKQCEEGYYQLKYIVESYLTGYGAKSSILPDNTDIINSLILDSSVLDYSSFEQWASDFGYDPDSRKGERMYNECLKIALALRNSFGDTLINELKEALQDY